MLHAAYQLCCGSGGKYGITVQRYAVFYTLRQFICNKAEMLLVPFTYKLGKVAYGSPLALPAHIYAICCGKAAMPVQAVKQRFSIT